MPQSPTVGIARAVSAETTSSLRIEREVERGSCVVIDVDGAQVIAYEGETVAVALLAAGVRELRDSPGAGTPRGVFCLMGVCQECLLRIDGRRALACQEAVREGMQIRTGAIP